MYPENIDRFERIIEKLREFTGLIIVEGKRDEESLRKLGVRTEILRLSRSSLADIALMASEYEEVMILTDFDNTGEQLAKKLHSLLEGLTKVDIETRRELKFIAMKDAKGIEDLYSLWESLSLRFWPPEEGI
ncbi:toprim domain-containing protein [Pyrococcus sp. ST04]|uniref:toprim domain-containing protein n=1 Tax=Pyrococcus sp. ST04 TaxID=1183377 RepID=UPI00064E2DAA|nr:toprim domain-containing protein [Pyrococcus sp. ST04]